MCYVKFNLDNLYCLVAIHFSNTTKYIYVVKLEGNFNKALYLTINNGNKVIAKLPCPNTSP